MYHKPSNNSDEFVAGYTRTDGVEVSGHYRSGKQFRKNKWLDVPKHIRRNDAEFIDYNLWRISQGLSDLF